MEKSDSKAELVINAMSMAMTRQHPESRLLHHSDRSGQCALSRSTARFGTRESLQSMGSSGDAYDNAAVESCMFTVKTELVRRNTFKPRNPARLAIYWLHRQLLLPA